MEKHKDKCEDKELKKILDKQNDKISALQKIVNSIGSDKKDSLDKKSNISNNLAELTKIQNL